MNNFTILGWSWRFRGRALGRLADRGNRVLVEVVRSDGVKQNYWKSPEEAKALQASGRGTVKGVPLVANRPDDRKQSFPTQPTPKREWVPALPHLPKDTAVANKTPDGKWTPERKALHDQIIAKLSGDHRAMPKPDEVPTAILMMGGPGSGKSSLTRSLDTSRFVVINSDDVKEQLPEYKEAVAGNARNAAAMVHEESSEIAHQIRNNSINAGKHILFDGTGKNPVDYAAVTKRLQDKGYFVQLLAVHLDADEGVSRAQGRAEREGRFVPEPVIRSTYDAIPGSYEKVSKLTNAAVLYDNTTGKLLHARDPDGEDVLHPEGYAAFRKLTK